MFKYIGGILLAVLILAGGAYYYHASAQAKEVKKETAFINNAQQTFSKAKTFSDKLASYQNLKERYDYYKANGKNNQGVLSKYQQILAQDQHYFTDKLDKLLKANTFSDDQLSELSKADVKKAKADLKAAKKYLAKISPIYSKDELKAKQAQIDALLNKLDQPVKKKHHKKKKKKKAQASSSSSVVASSSSEEASSSSVASTDSRATTTIDSTTSQTTTYQVIITIVILLLKAMATTVTMVTTAVVTQTALILMAVEILAIALVVTLLVKIKHQVLIPPKPLILVQLNHQTVNS